MIASNWDHKGIKGKATLEWQELISMKQLS